MKASLVEGLVGWLKGGIGWVGEVINSPKKCSPCAEQMAGCGQQDRNHHNYMSPLATTPHARHCHHLGLDQGAKVVTRPTRPSSTPPDPDTTRSRHDPIPTRHDQGPLRPTTQQSTAKLKSPPNFESDQTTSKLDRELYI